MDWEPEVREDWGSAGDENSQKIWRYENPLEI